MLIEQFKIYQIHEKKVVLLWKEHLAEVTEDGDDIDKLHTELNKQLHT